MKTRLFLLLPSFALVGSLCSVFDCVQLKSSPVIRYFPSDSCLILVVMFCIDSPALVLSLYLRSLRLRFASLLALFRFVLASKRCVLFWIAFTPGAHRHWDALAFLFCCRFDSSLLRGVGG